MSLLSNLRTRLNEALEGHAAEWRPGGDPRAAPTARETGAEFRPDENTSPESAPRPKRATPSPPSPPATAAWPIDSLLARLRSPHALREAFVVKEILDRPVALRPPRGRGIRG